MPDGIHRYLTAQNSVVEGEAWDGLYPEDMRRLLGLTNHLPWRIDFDSFYMSRVKEPNGEKPLDERNLTSLDQIHFAGSTEDEFVYERVQTGGFFTQALAELQHERLTLPSLLRAIRSKVNASLDTAKSDNAIERDKIQTPQIFSSTKLGLEDTQALVKFQRYQLV
ncbi:hypothetical protein FRC07_003099 [Ceratobasidium sp. 392]|nr:hypothetical protein FRC07_003099 [Ceratobasidium sp. 392]